MESRVHFPIFKAYGCCKTELENVQGSTYDWARLGAFDATEVPEEANLLVVSGWISPAVAEGLRDTYARMRGQKSVIAVGACALSGGPYILSGEKPVLASDILPVDVYLPGCPPRPEALIDALRMLQQKLVPGPDTVKVLYSALKDMSR